VAIARFVKDLRTLSRAKAGDGCAEVCLRRIPELLDERMSFERLLHDAALHTLASPVNQAHFTEAGVMRRDYVFVDDRGDVAWREGVKVE
jgi:hypothetical protein